MAIAAPAAFAKRPTWVPILTALILPPLFVVAMFVVSARLNPDAWSVVAPGTTSAARPSLADPTVTAQLAIRLMDSRNQPVVGRRGEVRHEPDPGEISETLSLQTGSGGFATVSFPKVGNVIARLEGAAAAEESVLSLEASTRDTYTLTLV